MTRWLLLPCLAMCLHAQPAALTNQDVVALAKAGFREDLIVDVISKSHIQFDTSDEALAELSNSGLSERVITSMKTGPAPKAKEKVAAKSPSVISQAIATQTPYYEWKSAFFGLTTKKVGVGAAAPPPKNASGAELNDFLRGAR